MKSGDSGTIDDLSLIIDAKRHGPPRTMAVVSDASRWLRAALKGADMTFDYASCEEHDHYGFSAFHIIRSYQDQPVSLDLKIAEIQDRPYVFAEVRSLGQSVTKLFPYFGALTSPEEREQLLHYVADFVISTGNWKP